MNEGSTLSGVDMELQGTGYRLSLNKKRFATGMHVSFINQTYHMIISAPVTQIMSHLFISLGRYMADFWGDPPLWFFKKKKKKKISLETEVVNFEPLDPSELGCAFARKARISLQ